MSEYMMDDVQMMLQGSRRLDEMQSDIRQFVALMSNSFNQMCGPEPRSHPKEFRIPFAPNNKIIGTWVLNSTSTGTAIGVLYGSEHHALFNDLTGYHPLPQHIVERAWRGLPSLLNAVGEYGTDPYQLLTFLKYVGNADNAPPACSLCGHYTVKQGGSYFCKNCGSWKE